MSSNVHRTIHRPTLLPFHSIVDSSARVNNTNKGHSQKEPDSEHLFILNQSTFSIQSPSVRYNPMQDDGPLCRVV